MGSNLEVLAKNRDALLLAEIAAWLHMFGKLHEDFLNGIHDLDREIPADIKGGFPELYDLLANSNWAGSIWGKLPNQTELRVKGLKFVDLIKRHRPPNKGHEGFVRLMQDAHGRGSGIEKGVLAKSAPEHENERPTYLATSLGYEIDLDNTAIYNQRRHLYVLLQEQLVELHSYLASLKKNMQLDISYWLSFKKRFIEIIESSFRISVAETRRPFNDVTLFDQTALSVACFKTSIAQQIFEGWKDPGEDLVENKYHWRFLHIGIDEQQFWGTSIRVGDLLARKQLIKEALDEVKTLLEVTYPLGFEIYRDGSGSVLLMPGVSKDTLQSDLSEVQKLEKSVQEIAERKFTSEANFKLSLSPRTRNTLSLGKLVTTALPPLNPDLKKIKSWWQNNLEDICPICGLRPQGPGAKAKSRKICENCNNRRYKSAEQWMQDLSTTVWIDEVADKNDRVALITASFNIEDWLSGQSFNSILSYDFVRHNKIDLFNLFIEIKNALEQDLQFDVCPILSGLLPDEKRGDLKTVRSCYELYVIDTDLNANDSTYHPELLALSLMRQWPAPARIYRTWRTTQTFWETTVSNFKTPIGEISPRLKINGIFTAEPDVKDTLGISHTYELKLENVNLSIAYTADGEFISVDNLERTFNLLSQSANNQPDDLNFAENIQRLLRDKSFPIEEPTGYGSSNKILGTLQIGVVNLETTPYVPAISIVTEPRTFMALVPADKALNVVKAIREKYEKEIGKVHNRLPLNLGIVFAGRRTPLPAILDAGRRMLKQPTQDDYWTVVQKGEVKLLDSSYPDEVTLTLERDGQTLPIKVRTVMGDGKIEDNWYPYWHVEQDKDGPIKPFSRGRQFTGLNGQEWVHVCDLKKDDVVQFMPSRFDYEFLDTAARRFEVSYDDSGNRRGSNHPSRPYYLEKLGDFKKIWKMLSNGLSSSQINNLVGTIETKRMEWAGQEDNTVFQQIVRDALNNANWKKGSGPGNTEFEMLYKAAVSGQLTDTAELYMSILKEKPDADEREGKE